MGGTVCKRLFSTSTTLLRYIFAPPLTQEVLSHKKGGRGTPRYLSTEEERGLAQEVSKGRFKTAGEIRDWIESEYEVSYKPGGVYSLLKRLGCSPKVPRAFHEKADLGVQRVWKKGA